MIRDFEVQDMNGLVKLMEQHATEAGEGVGTFKEKNLIEMIRQHHIQPNRKFIVAERQGEIKGYAMCTVFDNPYNGMREGLINFIYADPSYRQGFMAKDLLSGAEQWFRDRECKFFNANTRAFDEFFQPNQEFIESADSFFAKTMTHCGSNYVKEIM